jgi:hypothetical protein
MGAFYMLILYRLYCFELHKSLGWTSSERRLIVKIRNKVMSVLFLGTNAVYMVAVVSMTIRLQHNVIKSTAYNYYRYFIIAFLFLL